MTEMARSLLLLGVAALSLAEGRLTAEEAPKVTTWPQWRGPNRDGHVASGPAWPDRLSKESLERLWRVPLGPSYSGPVVAEELVFTTETRKKETEAVYALDRKTGKEKWRAEWKGSMTVPFFASSNGSWMRSTPAYDGERLYVAGMRDVLACLETKTGKEVWRVDFVKECKTPLPDFGFVCSPLVDGDAVYVQAGASVAKLDKKRERSSGERFRTRGACSGRPSPRRSSRPWRASGSWSCRHGRNWPGSISTAARSSGPPSSPPSAA